MKFKVGDHVISTILFPYVEEGTTGIVREISEVNQNDQQLSLLIKFDDLRGSYWCSNSDIRLLFEPNEKLNKAAQQLPEDPQERKEIPLFSGCIDYFAAALAEVAKISLAGNLQHNGADHPLRWDRSKSLDHVDCVARHLVDRGKFDTDGKRHTAKAAWRVLAELQTELENEGAPLSRASINHPRQKEST